VAADGEVRPLSAIRRSIAKHMLLSKQTSPHVTTVMEADLTRVVQARERLKDEYQRQGTKLTFTPFFLQAIIAGLRAVPEANSSFQNDSLLLHRHINLGMAVAIPDGLIVPVIRDADEKSLLGLARAVNDLAERARMKRLAPEEVQDGTFTLTNHGTAGSLFATPIINQPQSGILGVGAIQKRPVVISHSTSLLPGPDDYLAIRPMAYLSFTFDHRVLDGAGADGFLAAVKDFLEGYGGEASR
jgi:2-oxoglutarate dehydrogenase E2 component (dihydrolipoamide succinyltransferase)